MYYGYMKVWVGTQIVGKIMISASEDRLVVEKDLETAGTNAAYKSLVYAIKTVHPLAIVTTMMGIDPVKELP